MKKILFFAFALALTASISFAAEASKASNTGSSDGKVILQLQGGIVIPMSSQAASMFDMGGGGEIQVGYAFSKDFSLSLEGGYEMTPVKSSMLQSGFTSMSVGHVPIELVGQYNIVMDGGVSPYIVLGVGIAMDSVSSSPAIPAGWTTSWTNPEIDPGIGVAFKAGDNMNIFVQAKYCMDMETTTGDKAQGNDSPLASIPIQIGLNYLFQ